MENDHLPTLFEVLNRFSKAPLDLWSFYVFLKEQYGGVEYLEFWLDCASHAKLCKEHSKELRSLENDLSNPPNISRGFKDTSHRHSRGPNGSDVSTPRSSVLFNMLQEHGNAGANDANQAHTRTSSNYSDTPLNIDNNSVHDEDLDLFNGAPLSERTNRMSTVSQERTRNKRDTMSRLSEILDNLNMPEYPDSTATSPSRHANLQNDVNNEYRGFYEENRDSAYVRRSQSPVKSPSPVKGGDFSDLNAGFLDGISGAPKKDNGDQDPSRPPPKALLPNPPDLESALFEKSSDMNLLNPHINHDSSNVNSSHRASFPSRLSVSSQSNVGYQQISNSEVHITPTAGTDGSVQIGKVSPGVVRESAQQIINTYLSPKSPKEIELPSDSNGWSMAADIRNIGKVPHGLTNPRLFDNATGYVFEALEREALPVFLLYRGLSNVQPLSASFRLITGLISLFGGFWLSFVFILLSWEPKSHRCWVILPFGIGMYLTFTALYHIDPLLAFIGLYEKDGGGLNKVLEPSVRTMQVRRASFVLITVILCAAAFSVLFIFVPGHRL